MTTSDVRHMRLLQHFTLQSPLSHIGETLSNTQYLVQEPVLQPDGEIVEVFAYAGNAWRGQLRDLMATYFLEHLGNPTIGLDAFHALYSGGSISGTHATDVAQARAFRRTITPIGLLGAGTGSQILPGKIRVSNLYPLCREAPRTGLFPDLEARRQSIRYRGLTFEKDFSRMEDLTHPDTAERALGRETLDALTAGMSNVTSRRGDERSQQMRYGTELLIGGAELTGHIDLLGVSDVEIGCVVAALHQFSRSPHIGGQAGRGHGRVALGTTLVDLDTGETTPAFVRVAERCLLSPPAEDAKAAYDAHLRSLYDAMLANNGDEIRAMIGAGS